MANVEVETLKRIADALEKIVKLMEKELERG